MNEWLPLSREEKARQEAELLSLQQESLELQTRREEMSEQTMPDIYGWIETMRDRYEAIAGMIIVEVEADLTTPSPGTGGDEDD